MFTHNIDCKKKLKYLRGIIFQHIHTMSYLQFDTHTQIILCQLNKQIIYTHIHIIEITYTYNVHHEILTHTQVYLVPYFNTDKDPIVRHNPRTNVLEIFWQSK